MGNEALRHLGSIYTPQDFAQFLTTWAIQTQQQRVLDIGVGEGVFVFAAYNRLLELGAIPRKAQHQIYGTEIHQPAYKNFVKVASKSGIRFPHIYPIDFFNADFPPVDAVVGNPPYVRRTYIENVDQIRRSVIEGNHSLEDFNLSRLTDLYIYFLLTAASILKPEGRLAVITADPWLNTRYGEAFKRYLNEHFEIENLISLDRQVFEAQVKAVLLMATKKNSIDSNRSVCFVRLKNGLPISDLRKWLCRPQEKSPDILISRIKSSELKPIHPWSLYFKTPDICEEISSHKLMTTFENIAETRIGLQTLAKEFFVLTSQQAQSAQIESEFLQPLAQSPKFSSNPIIEADREPMFYIFYCSKSKKELRETRTLQYILQGETTEVKVRGKGTTVIGYQNKERIKSARREYWYDLKTDLERRGRATILIPRLVYRSFVVVWNKASFVPGELFIEFLPPSDSKIDQEVYLAILASSVNEILLRAHAQVYGGGTYNINPGQIKKVPILNVELLTAKQKNKLKQAYLKYISDENHNRSVIDKAIYKILRFDNKMQQRLKEVLEDLLLIATSAKKSNSTSAESIQK